MMRTGCEGGDAEQISPKAGATLSGSLHEEYTRCGKEGCRCTRGEWHGPYWRRFWRENGRTRSAYVPLALVPVVAAACARHQAQHPSGRALRRLLREHDALLSEVLAALQQEDVAGTDPCVEEWEAQP